jgi:hypothetical protein
MLLIPSRAYSLRGDVSDTLAAGIRPESRTMLQQSCLVYRCFCQSFQANCWILPWKRQWMFAPRSCSIYLTKRPFLDNVFHCPHGSGRGTSPHPSPFGSLRPNSIYIYMNTYPTHIYPENRDSMYLWNVGNAARIHTVQSPERRGGIDNEPPWMPKVINYPN